MGIGSGFVVVFGLLASKRLDGWTSLFLTTTVATSVTGFFFPFHGFSPAYAVGTVSLIVLAIAILARYRFRLAGGWRRTHVIAAVIGLYLNFFVLIAQLFQKVPALKAMAPTQSEPPIPSDSDRGAGAVCGAGDSRGDEVPRLTISHGLINTSNVADQWCLD